MSGPPRGPSGVGGITGRVADAFDRLPVKGFVAVLVVVGGTIVALLHGGFATGDCATDPLHKVYRPQRLHVVATCQDVTGTVVAWRHEHDGDYHVGMRMDDPSWVNLANVERQHGLTVVEFVPTMPRPAKFFSGQRLRLRTTKVLDLQHSGFIEAHPVFAVEDVTAEGKPEGPNHPALVPPTE